MTPEKVPMMIEKSKNSGITKENTERGARCAVHQPLPLSHRGDPAGRGGHRSDGPLVCGAAAGPAPSGTGRRGARHPGSGPGKAMAGPIFFRAGARADRAPPYDGDGLSAGGVGHPPAHPIRPDDDLWRARPADRPPAGASLDVRPGGGRRGGTQPHFHPRPLPSRHRGRRQPDRLRRWGGTEEDAAAAGRDRDQRLKTAFPVLRYSFIIREHDWNDNRYNDPFDCLSHFRSSWVPFYTKCEFLFG